jgi:hypothetical protein
MQFKSLYYWTNFFIQQLREIFFSPRLTFKLMEFNIEEGGTLVSFDKVIEAILVANPDVVAIEEGNNNIALIAQRLGWSYYDPQLQIISRFPLIQPSSGKGIFTYVELSPNKVIALCNVHLPDEPYGPQQLQKGLAPKEVLEIEKKVRLAALKPYLSILTTLTKSGVPVFLVGDFNTPSHLDWNSFSWPVSKVLEEMGFLDSYRAIYKNAFTHPGHTWWANRPPVRGWNPTVKDKHDRIDFLYVAGSVKTMKSEIIGEENQPGVSICVMPWPSDHRAIMSTFVVKPVKPPVL